MIKCMQCPGSACLLSLCLYFNIYETVTIISIKFKALYCILSSIVHTFYIKNGAKIFHVHYMWKVAEKGFKMAFMMNKLAMINSCEIILENKKKWFFCQKHCEIQVRTILVCPIYSIKCGTSQLFVIASYRLKSQLKMHRTAKSHV